MDKVSKPSGAYPKTYDADELTIGTIVDIKALQEMMDHFYEVTRIGIAIDDLKGNILVSTGWQDICTKFHRCHPETLKNCIESDTYFAKSIAVEGEYTIYKCKNGMWDMVTPIIVEGKHIANLFLGQFFFDDEEPDREFFARQAEKYGFNKEAYLAALDRAPRWSREKVGHVMMLYTGFARMISSLGYSNLELARLVDKQQRSEEALRKSEAYLIKAQQLAHIGSWSLDIRTKEITASDETGRLFGIDPGTRWTYALYRSRVHPEDILMVERTDMEAIASGKPINFEYRLVLPDGSGRVVHTMGEVRADDNGKPVEIFGTIQDITERKHAEEALMAAKAQAELYLDLMGHDINNMHQVALGYLELAREMETDEVHKKMLDKPMEVLQRSSLLIKNVRKLQKVHDGSYQNMAIDVCTVLDDVSREYAAMRGKAITLNLNGFTDCRILANELLRDVFSNLVDNAIKHTDESSKIAIALEKVMLDGDLYYRISVEDDGPGISDDHKATIFDRMRKGNSKVQGTGLGLYLVRSLVESYNGRVLVEDRIPGDHSKGVRFIMLLPAI